MNDRKLWAVILISTIALGIIYMYSNKLHNIGSIPYNRTTPKAYFYSGSKQEKFLSSKHCSYPFYVFIHPLPTVFNTQIIPILESILKNSSYCPAHGNMEEKTLLEGNCPLLQFNTEILIHWLLAKHPCVTSDPKKASFFYLPVYPFFMRVAAERGKMEATFREPLKLLDQMLRNSSKVDAFFKYADRQALLDRQKMLQKSGQVKSTTFSSNNSQLYSIVEQHGHTLPSAYKSYLYRKQLCDHVFTASRIFYGSDGPYIWQAPRGHGFQHNIIWLTIEIYPRHPFAKYRSPKLTKNIAIPYVVSGKLHDAGNLIREELQRRVAAMNIENINIEPCRIFCSGNFSTAFFEDHLNRSYNRSFQRPLLAYFAGGTVSFRRYLQVLLNTMQASVYKVIPHSIQRLDSQLTLGYLQSTFCFVLPGDSPSSKRLYDTIAGNCIPVIISDKWQLPFSHLPWETFSLRFTDDDLIKNNSIIRSALTSMPAKQILTMQINLYYNRHHFLYPLDAQEYISQPDDAVDKIFQELSLRQQYAQTCQHNV